MCSTHTTTCTSTRSETLKVTNINSCVANYRRIYFCSDPSDCTEVSGPSGFYDIKIGDEVVSVYCNMDMDGGSWLVSSILQLNIVLHTMWIYRIFCGKYSKSEENSHTFTTFRLMQHRCCFITPCINPLGHDSCALCYIQKSDLTAKQLMGSSDWPHCHKTDFLIISNRHHTTPIYACR